MSLLAWRPGAVVVRQQGPGLLRRIPGGTSVANGWNSVQATTTRSPVATSRAIGTTSQWMSVRTAPCQSLLDQKRSACWWSTMVPYSSRNSLSPHVSLQHQQLVRSFASKKHRNVLRQTKGFRGRNKNCFSLAIRTLHRSWQHAYRSRKLKKRNWRRLWILRIGAAVRQYSWRYSKFISIMGHVGLKLNRKVLSELAIQEPFAMKSVVDAVTVMNQQHKQQQKAISESVV